jgi:hypothetical protein
MTKQHPNAIKTIETSDLAKTTGGWGGPPPGYWAARRDAYYGGYGPGPGYGAGPGWGGGPGWSHGYRYWY